MAPARPYTTSGFTDEMMCFVIDPELAAPAWLTGLQFSPGNMEVVHHATLVVAPPDAAGPVRDRGGADGAHRCFGGIGVAGAYTLGVWVPGSRPFESPIGTRIPIAAGSLLVLQVHYHPVGFDHDPDLTSFDLRLTTESPGRTFFYSALGNAFAPPILQPGPGDRGQVEFRIPAGASDHTEQMKYRLELDSAARFPMTGIFPHMH